jgi:hypothetical protein
MMPSIVRLDFASKTGFAALTNGANASAGARMALRTDLSMVVPSNDNVQLCLGVFRCGSLLNFAVRDVEIGAWDV